MTDTIVKNRTILHITWTHEGEAVTKPESDNDWSLMSGAEVMADPAWKFEDLRRQIAGTVQPAGPLRASEFDLMVINDVVIRNRYGSIGGAYEQRDDDAVTEHATTEHWSL